MFATGVLAQSVGGGGGAGGDARTYQIDLSANPTDFLPFMDLIQFDATLVIGGSGGNGGSGGRVVATGDTDIVTTGAFAHGLVAQSVGGGGGAGGDALTFAFSNTDIPGEIPPLDELNDLTNLSMVLEGGGGAAGDKAVGKQYTEFSQGFTDEITLVSSNTTTSHFLTESES